MIQCLSVRQRSSVHFHNIKKKLWGNFKMFDVPYLIGKVSMGPLGFPKATQWQNIYGLLTPICTCSGKEVWGSWWSRHKDAPSVVLCHAHPWLSQCVECRWAAKQGAPVSPEVAFFLLLSWLETFRISFIPETSIKQLLYSPIGNCQLIQFHKLLDLHLLLVFVTWTSLQAHVRLV